MTNQEVHFSSLLASSSIACHSPTARGRPCPAFPRLSKGAKKHGASAAVEFLVVRRTLHLLLVIS